METNIPFLFSFSMETNFPFFRVTSLMIGESFQDPNRNIQMQVDGEPLVYDLSGISKTAFTNAVNDSLMDGLGFTDVDFPLFVGVDLSFRVSFYVKNMRKDKEKLVKFVTDALESVVYLNREMIVHIKARRYRVDHVDEEITYITVGPVSDNDTGV
jgi:hypothetical protein